MTRPTWSPARKITRVYIADGRRAEIAEIAEIAGQRLTVDGHRALLTAFRMTRDDDASPPNKTKTEVIVAVDTGRRMPAIVTISVP